jgi:hypothetical protein
MKSKLKTSLLVLLTLLILLVSLRIYLKNIYYPNNPWNHFVYEENPDYVPNKDYPLQPMQPPFGGCSSACGGNVTLISCEPYSPMFNECEYKCYGPIYNNCSGNNLYLLGYLFISILIR